MSRERFSPYQQPELPDLWSAPPAVPDSALPATEHPPQLPVFDATTLPDGLFADLKEQEIVTIAGVRVISSPEIRVIRRRRLRSGKTIETKEWLCRAQHPEGTQVNAQYNLLLLHATTQYENAVKLKIQENDQLTVSGRLTASLLPQGDGTSLPVHDLYLTAISRTKRPPKSPRSHPLRPEPMF